MIYFTSDTHWGHNNIIKYSNRPFNSVYEMDVAMVANWNAVVRDNDDIYHLGDVSFHKDVNVTKGIVAQLQGRKHLILGNHDYLKREEYLEMGFLTVEHYAEIKHNKHKYCLMHYPIASWNKAHRDAYHLHGHCHGTFNRHNVGLTRIDVGVENFAYAPVSIDDIEIMMSKRNPPSVDHHV